MGKKWSFQIGQCLLQPASLFFFAAGEKKNIHHVPSDVLLSVYVTQHETRKSNRFNARPFHYNQKRVHR